MFNKKGKEIATGSIEYIEQRCKDYKAIVLHRKENDDGSFTAWLYSKEQEVVEGQEEK